MGKYIQPFACNECMEFIEGQTKEEHRKKCKGKPSILDAAPVKEPVKPASVPAPEPEKPVSEPTEGNRQVEYNRRWREKNKEKHKEYMREYMKAKRAKVRENK